MRFRAALGLALLTMLAVLGTHSPSAQATAAKFVSSNETTTLLGTAEADPSKKFQLLVTDAGTLECEEFSATYNGPTESPEATLTNIKYGGECNIGGLAAEVKFNGCDYLFHSGSKTEKGSSGTVDFKCPVGKQIEAVSTTKCTIKVGAQEGKGPINYTNVQTGGKKKELTVDSEAKSISYSYEGSVCGSGSNTNGIYIGKSTVRTANGKGPLDLEISAGAQFKATGEVITAEITAEADPSKKFQLLITDIGTVECEGLSATYSGATESSEATFTGIEYSNECNIGGLEAEVKFNGCDYLFHSGSKTEKGSEGTVDLKCPEGKKVEAIIPGGICTVKAGTQEGLSKINYTNVQTGGKKKELTVDSEAKSIGYSYEGSVCGSGSNTNGIYIGKSTLRAVSSKGTPLDLEISASAKFKASDFPVEAVAETDPESIYQLFETDAGPVECEEFFGVYKGQTESTEVTLTEIRYGGNCNIAGLEAEVKFNGCSYLFHAGTKTEKGSEGTVDLKCPEGKKVEAIAVAELCTVRIGPQNFLGPIQYRNVKTGEKKELTVIATIVNIQYTYEGLLCGTGSPSNGIYEGHTTVRALTSKGNGLDFEVQ